MSRKKNPDKKNNMPLALTFGEAIAALKNGFKLSRAGWNGKNMYIKLVRPVEADRRDYIEMKTVDDQFVPWVASQTDILADDWFIYEPAN